MPKPTTIQKVFANIHKNVYSKPWKCIIDNCDNQAINSHLLQKNGILDNVATEGHLIECKQSDPFSWTESTGPIIMKRLGKNNAFSLPLFCNQHDTSIFIETEKHPIDLNSYRVQLLLCYRVICAEIRKKERNVELYKRMLNAETLKGEINFQEIKWSLEGNELGIIDLNIIKKIFEEELENNKSNFTFKLYKYPLIQIYGSSAFTPVDYSKVSPDQEKPFNSAYIHVIPYNDELNVIVGYNNDYVDDWIKEYVNSWDSLEEKEFEKKLTHLFAAHIENWGISPTLYAELKKENINLLLDYMNQNANNLSQSQVTNFNLFELKE